MTTNVYKQRENILKRVIESIIMPKYPEIKSVSVVSDFGRAIRHYSVFLNAKDITAQRARAMEDEIETLFIMCGLDVNNRQTGRDFVDVYLF